MPKRKLGDMNDAIRDWASAELDGQPVSLAEARAVVAAYHEGGLEGFARNYDTDYSTPGGTP
ncbi:MAG: hypothetical protein HOY78_02625 [Saccharothrix sp.]|nr:hypothetical protein [Saccharothrix sp.]